MTEFERAALRELALRVLTHHQTRSGVVPGPIAVSAATRHAYDHLARVLAPVIGRIGVDTLIGRAVHLAQREYPWLAITREPERANGPFIPVAFSLQQQDPAVATDAAAEVLAIFAGLLVTFIGEPLTMRLVRKAWPDAFSGTDAEERRA